MLDTAHPEAAAQAAVDDTDGAPVSVYGSGDVLPAGLAAWERLGVGRRCETWLAWSRQLWGPVVAKFPRPHQLDHPRARAALRREVAALDGNLHPALPRLYEDGTGRDVPYVVFEYVDGPALDYEIEENGALSADEVTLLGVALLAALRTIHARGLVHVDVKPENVVLRDGRPVLIDCGSARPVGRPQPEGLLIGSPGYAAPDLEGGEPISVAMDVYGAGVTLHEALTGAQTFDPDDAAGDRPAPAALTDDALGMLVMRMLDPEPAARPALDDALATLAALAEQAGRNVRPPWLR